MKLEFSQHIFEIASNINFRENVSIWSRVIHAGGQTDTTKLIVAFSNSADVSKIEFVFL